MLITGKREATFHLCDFAKKRGVNWSVLGDGHCIPALILRRTTTALCMWATATPDTSSTHPTTRTTAHLLLGDEGLLHLHLLPVLFQFSIFVDLVNGLGALVTSPGNPVVLGWGERKEILLSMVKNVKDNFLKNNGHIFGL